MSKMMFMPMFSQSRSQTNKTTTVQGFVLGQTPTFDLRSPDVP